MPTNLYGPGDNFSPSGSHLLPALIRRYDEAKASGAKRDQSVPARPDGCCTRRPGETACICQHFDGPTHVNVGTGTTSHRRDRRWLPSAGL